MNTNFTDIKGFKGKYAINRNGDVVSYLNNRWGTGGHKILKPIKGSHGYYSVSFGRNPGKGYIWKLA